MFLAISIICAAVLLAVVLARHMRDRREMERHTITPAGAMSLTRAVSDEELSREILKTVAERLKAPALEHQD